MQNAAHPLAAISTEQPRSSVISMPMVVRYAMPSPGGSLIQVQQALEHFGVFRVMNMRLGFLRMFASLRPITFLIHRWLWEIGVAVVLAIVTAISIETYRDKVRFETLQNNLRAVATLEVYDDQQKLIGQGTGFFITPTGVLVTAYHVIRGGANVVAHLRSGAFYKLRGFRQADDKADIAILQFDAQETPAVKALGDSDRLWAGQQIYAIGTPVNLEETVSTGNISNPLQEIGGHRFIQFTAQISVGSGGGGLFDEHGKVVGITAGSRNIFSGSQAGTAQNLNFAVPINDVKDVLGGGAYGLLRESPAYYYSLGNLADNKREWDKAIELYRKALALDNKYTDAYLGLGSDYYEKRQYDLELDNYQKAALTASADAKAWYWLGAAYEDIGQFDLAATTYVKALAIDPNYKEALHDLTILYLAEGKVDQATNLLPRLTALDKGYGMKLRLLIGRMK
jgi:S1-C subfamily serine protease